jgi:hypothetical protein
VIYYKVLDEQRDPIHGGRGRYVARKWMPEQPVNPCASGYHACRRDDLVNWLGPVIWECRLRDVVESDDKVVGSSIKLLRRVLTWTPRTQRLFAADCAEHVVHLCGDDPRPAEAIEVARRYAEGQATYEELAAARDAARGAARAAAWAAAWDVAGAAARDAAWDAERRWQKERLWWYLDGEPSVSCVAPALGRA